MVRESTARRTLVNQGNSPAEVRKRLQEGVRGTGTFVQSIRGTTGRVSATEATLVQREYGTERVFVERGFSGFDNKARTELKEAFATGDIQGISTEASEFIVRDLKSIQSRELEEIEARIKSEKELIARGQELRGGELRSAQNRLGILQSDRARLLNESNARIAVAEAQLGKRYAEARQEALDTRAEKISGKVTGAVGRISALTEQKDRGFTTQTKEQKTFTALAPAKASPFTLKPTAKPLSEKKTSNIFDVNLGYVPSNKYKNQVKNAPKGLAGVSSFVSTGIFSSLESFEQGVRKLPTLFSSKAKDVQRAEEKALIIEQAKAKTKVESEFIRAELQAESIAKQVNKKGEKLSKEVEAYNTKVESLSNKSNVSESDISDLEKEKSKLDKQIEQYNENVRVKKFEIANIERTAELQVESRIKEYEDLNTARIFGTKQPSEGLNLGVTPLQIRQEEARKKAVAKLQEEKYSKDFFTAKFTSDVVLGSAEFASGALSLPRRALELGATNPITAGARLPAEIAIGTGALIALNPSKFAGGSLGLAGLGTGIKGVKATPEFARNVRAVAPEILAETKGTVGRVKSVLTNKPVTYIDRLKADTTRLGDRFTSTQKAYGRVTFGEDVTLRFKSVKESVGIKTPDGGFDVLSYGKSETRPQGATTKTYAQQSKASVYGASAEKTIISPPTDGVITAESAGVSLTRRGREAKATTSITGSRAVSFEREQGTKFIGLEEAKPTVQTSAVVGKGQGYSQNIELPNKPRLNIELGKAIKSVPDTGANIIFEQPTTRVDILTTERLSSGEISRKVGFGKAREGNIIGEKVTSVKSDIGFEAPKEVYIEAPRVENQPRLVQKKSALTITEKGKPVFDYDATFGKKNILEQSKLDIEFGKVDRYGRPARESLSGIKVKEPVPRTSVNQQTSKLIDVGGGQKAFVRTEYTAKSRSRATTRNVEPARAIQPELPSTAELKKLGVETSLGEGFKRIGELSGRAKIRGSSFDLGKISRFGAISAVSAGTSSYKSPSISTKGFVKTITTSRLATSSIVGINTAQSTEQSITSDLRTQPIQTTRVITRDVFGGTPSVPVIPTGTGTPPTPPLNPLLFRPPRFGVGKGGKGGYKFGKTRKKSVTPTLIQLETGVKFTKKGKSKISFTGLESIR